MKIGNKFLVHTLFIIIGLCSLLMLSSCENNDDEVITDGHSKEVVGEYPSNCELGAMGAFVDMGEVVTKISAKDTSNVIIETPSITWGNKVFPVMKVESFVKEDIAGEVYSVSGSFKVIGTHTDTKVDFPMAGHMTGVINTITKIIKFKYVVNIKNMPMPLEMHIHSKLSTTEE